MRLDLIWERVLLKIKPVINKQAFDSWLKPTFLHSINEKEIEVSVPNQFFGEWITDHYHVMIIDGLKRELSQDNIKVKYISKENLSEQAGEEVFKEKEDFKKEKKKQLAYNLNPRYQFDSFVVGTSNQFAHAASLKVAERPGLTYNPLFLYGGVGLGKTHLLSAIGNYLYKDNESIRITYLSAEKFTNDVINSIRYNKMAEFRNRYRNGDVLLIDDIQFISGKERTQEEFFHTFNALYEENKQLVISSDRSVKEISDIEERLRSRFEMGLIADIQPPDLETKIVILRRKAEIENISLPNNVCLFLASNIKTNIRVLEGSLIRLGAFSSLTDQKITVEMAKRVLSDTIQERKKDITIEEIIKTVTERFQIKVSELKSKKRTKNLVIPRQIGMYLSRELTSQSFPEIGKAFGGKDHSTVIHAYNQIDKLKNEDYNLKATLEDLAKRLREA